jgi:hypothetical protein
MNWFFTRLYVTLEIHPSPRNLQNNAILSKLFPDIKIWNTLNNNNNNNNLILQCAFTKISQCSLQWYYLLIQYIYIRLCS